MLNFCPHCGSKLQAGFRFCPSCGEKLPEIPSEEDEPSPPPEPHINAMISSVSEMEDKKWTLDKETEMEAFLDIVKREDILQSEGDVVEVKYEDESSPVVILRFNENKDKLVKCLNQRESESSAESKLAEKRATKNKRILSPENSPLSSPDHVQKRFKKVEKPQNDTRLLDGIETKNKANDTLHNLREEIAALRAENQQLKALNFKLQNEVINRFAEFLPNSRVKKHAVQSSLTSAACSAPLQPGNSSHLSFSELDHVEIHKHLNIAKDTFQACGRGGTSWSAMIKDLAVAVFGRSMLATHSLSGKTGNANKGSQAKPPLDPTKVKLIIDTVLKSFPTTPQKFLRAALREKMNDEHKLFNRQHNGH